MTSSSKINKSNHVHRFSKTEIPNILKLSEALDKFYGKDNYELKTTGNHVNLITSAVKRPVEELRKVGALSQDLKVYGGHTQK
ncbi:hypothetical protein QL093DRAFT_1078194 [Fusarium oxysporum]|nr:hypothetical protein QL093DRAFT_1078194 [Fusarium oxysporum]